jgi:hypothetical protein
MICLGWRWTDWARDQRVYALGVPNTDFIWRSVQANFPHPTAGRELSCEAP